APVHATELRQGSHHVHHVAGRPSHLTASAHVGRRTRGGELVMLIAIALALAVFLCAPALAEDTLDSPYRQQAAAGLRGLSESEMSELRAGAGMGLARAAELNGYPGPKHVLDAVAGGQLTVSAEQLQRIQKIFDAMKREAQRIGAKILERERQL